MCGVETMIPISNRYLHGPPTMCCQSCLFCMPRVCIIRILLVLAISHTVEDVSLLSVSSLCTYYLRLRVASNVSTVFILQGDSASGACVLRPSGGGLDLRRG